MPHLPTVRQTGVTRILLIGLMLLELTSANVQTVHAADTNATTTPAGMTVTTTTTVQTIPTPAHDTHTATIEETTPELDRPSAIKAIKVDTTAYTSTVEECDDSPFITADGSYVRDGIVATNILPFGTQVRFPALFGDRIFEVHDRMNQRYSYRVDFWMSDKKAMRQFGIKHNVLMEVVKMGDGKKQWKVAAK